MNDSAFVTMLVVLGIVWGGFLLILGYALKREAGKRRGSDPAQSFETQNDRTVHEGTNQSH